MVLWPWERGLPGRVLKSWDGSYWLHLIKLKHKKKKQTNSRGQFGNKIEREYRKPEKFRT